MLDSHCQEKQSLSMDLRTWRTLQSLTLKKLADKLQIDMAHLSKIERRKVGVSVDLAARIIKATGGEVELETLTKKTTGA